MTSDGSHERAMNGIDKLEKFQFDRYNFTLDSFTSEVFDAYTKCGNNCPTANWALYAVGGEDESSNVGFRLPVCVNDHLWITDFTKRMEHDWKRWQFPAVCGDWRASETIGFMRLLAMGVESDAYAAQVGLLCDHCT